MLYNVLYFVIKVFENALLFVFSLGDAPLIGFTSTLLCVNDEVFYFEAKAKEVKLQCEAKLKLLKAS